MVPGEELLFFFIYGIADSLQEMIGAYEAGSKETPRPAGYLMQVWDLHFEKMVAKLTT